ncbi:MAG: 3-deoxy-7-phosphoheptulonate synthase [Deltaproteobacteria bacterium]|nr:3-deoxy-7-phosphoheptulonate synthase [Deltaproteobacteria bacterium]MBW2309031.1 3-deoxy-7-phosphoheptulonate synthase [Deltaproteobacteria bacterium]
MIIVMKTKAKEEQVEGVIKKIQELGYRPHVSRGVERVIIGAVGDERHRTRLQALDSMPGVDSVIPILKPYKLASRDFKAENTLVPIDDGPVVGGKQFVVMAGPCSVESMDQLRETARAVKEAGASVLRGGAFKPRTSPYSFQGLEKEGLEMLAEVRKETGLPVVTEIMTIGDLDLVCQYADILQIGARNVQNYPLLRKVGTTRKPVLLKRGMMVTVEELLMAAEYILMGGNQNVILCERGIRTFETATRNTLDISAIPVIKEKSHLPVLADPSHSCGYWQYVHALSLAALAAGADGLLVEVHSRPQEALCDGGQSLKPEKFHRLMDALRNLAPAVGRDLSPQVRGSNARAIA